MIDAGFVRTMARYNAWQNKQLEAIVYAADDTVLTQDRGAFFGSIHGTLNHLLWGDQVWMSRFDPSVALPDGGIQTSTEITPTPRLWAGARATLDGKISYWAKSISNLDLTSDLTWFSGAAGKEVTRPLALCVTHFFNHQTHHRGQVHAMLTAAGQDAPVSDLFLMPEE